MSEQWIRENYLVGEVPLLGECIAWGKANTYFGVYTPIDKFLLMFGDIIEQALSNNKDVKQAIRDSDPENIKGFNDII